MNKYICWSLNIPVIVYRIYIVSTKFKQPTHCNSKTIWSQKFSILISIPNRPLLPDTGYKIKSPRWLIIYIHRHKSVIDFRTIALQLGVPRRSLSQTFANFNVCKTASRFVLWVCSILRSKLWCHDSYILNIYTHTGLDLKEDSFPFWGLCIVLQGRCGRSCPFRSRNSPSSICVAMTLGTIDFDADYGNL